MTTLISLNDYPLEYPIVNPERLGDFRLNDTSKGLLNSLLNENFYMFHTYTSYKIITNGNFAVIPNQFIRFLLIIEDLAHEIYKYIELFDSLRETVLVAHTSANSSFADLRPTIEASAAAEHLGSDEQIDLFVSFLATDTPEFRLGSKKCFDDGGRRSAKECFSSAILKAINLPDSSSQIFGELAYDICRKQGVFDNLRQHHDITEPVEGSLVQNVPPAGLSPLLGGENRLFYGAPGTGKSHRVQNIEAHGEVICTVFHPDTQNSDFIGSLKPTMKGEDQITYAFSPGPFAIALKDALANPVKAVTLVIEELNRAPAAAVFGELFLLLDRNENGEGSFACNFPTPEFGAWLNQGLSQPSEKMRIPSNLWIFATMNSADAGVYPLDTAFRRRWAATYVAIDYSMAPEGDIHFIGPDKTRSKVAWRSFVECLNNFLVIRAGVEEDRLVGPRFLTKQDLDAVKIPGKLMIYLWDDLLRHANRYEIFSEKIKNYGQLHVAQDKDHVIFSNAFLSELGRLATSVAGSENNIEPDSVSEKASVE